MLCPQSVADGNFDHVRSGYLEKQTVQKATVSPSIMHNTSYHSQNNSVICSEKSGMNLLIFSCNVNTKQLSFH